MKKYICIIFIMLVCFISCIINVEAMESEFEYYNITYEFLDSNEYYITYKFKPQNEYPSYYFEDELVYLDTIEHNLDDFENLNNSNDNDMKIKFSLKENKEYYIKYKGFLKEENREKNLLHVNPILKSSPRYVDDTSSAVSVYSFELRLYHPEKIGITEDKILNNENVIIEKKDDYLLLLSGEKYEKEKYYNVIIAKKLILKSDVEHNNLKKVLIVNISLGMIVIIVGICVSIKLRKHLSFLKRR